MRDKRMWRKLIAGTLTASMLVSMPLATIGAAEADPAAEAAVQEQLAAQATAEQAAAEQAAAQATAEAQAAAEAAAAQAAEQAAAEQAAAEQNAAQATSTNTEENNTAGDAVNTAETAGQAEQSTSDSGNTEQAEAEAAAQAEAQAAAQAAADQAAAEAAAAAQAAADSEVAVESREAWEITLPQILAHNRADVRAADYRADIAAIAESQVGYREAVSKDGSKKTTRYGAWFGDAYVSPWDALFAAFVLNYAGVTDMTYRADTAQWTNDLAAAGVFFDRNHPAETGDLVFLMEADGTFHVGVITAADAGTITVVGAWAGEVVKNVYDRNDTRIYAYGAVVKETAADIADAEAAKAAEETEAAADTETAESTELHLVETELQASLFTDGTNTEPLAGVSIVVNGNLPEGAAASAHPVIMESGSEESSAVYQLTIYDAEGSEYHSTAGDGESIVVTIHDPKLTEILQEYETVHGWHKNNVTAEEKEKMDYTVLEDGGVQFIADEF